MEEIPHGKYEIPLFNKYILESRKKIYGEINKVSVFIGRNIQTGEPVAIKLVKLHYEEVELLRHEAKLLIFLKKIERIPKGLYFGKQGAFSILIMNLLGPSLKHLMDYCQGSFSLPTTIKISLQLLNTLKQIHERGVLVRYMKPENMTIGFGENQKYIYIIDFGLAKLYMKNGQHIKFREKKHTKGNRVFISINIHSKIQTSRRDDIESLGYNMIFFMKGKLPWTHIKQSHDILEKKLNISLDELCEGTPDEFKDFIKYARNMKFEEEPDYAYLNKLLLKAAEKNGIELDKIEYDWEILQKKKDNNDIINAIGKNNDNNKHEKVNNNILNKNVKDDSEKQININNNIIFDDNADNEKNKEKNEEKEENKEKINDNENKGNEKNKKGEENNNIINNDLNLNKDEEERNEMKEDKKEKEENAENNVDIKEDKNSKKENGENIMEKNSVNALDNNINEINDINDMLENNKIED